MSLREGIINILEENLGHYVSGQEIANALSVSRSAVAKCIDGLKKEGYDIKSVNRLGHCLAQTCNLLSEARIAANIGDEVCVKVYKSIDSTNTLAKKEIANGLTRNAIFASEEQTAGRGRSGKSFYSPKSSGLYFSCILHPSVTLSDSVCLTSAAAVAVCEAIEGATKKHPMIKWVNDIFIDGYKVCGILTEAVSDFESGTVQAVVIGIGINLTTTQFPDELTGIASSLGVSVDKSRLVADIYTRLNELCNRLPDKSFMDIYRSHSLALGNTVYFSRNGKSYTATATAILDDGGLEVLTDENEKMILQSGEISIKLK